jgi:hypothetical protein
MLPETQSLERQVSSANITKKTISSIASKAKKNRYLSHLLDPEEKKEKAIRRYQFSRIV